MRAHLLVYDIPQKAGFNPSQFLWRFAARINLSCWVVPDANVALLPIKAWTEKGAKIELVRFDERDGETIIRLAREALLREIGAIRERLEEGIGDVKLRLAGITATVPDEAAIKKLGGKASTGLRRAKKSLIAAQECAATFDLMGEAQPVMDGLRECIKANEALAYSLFKAKPKTEPEAEQQELGGAA